MADIRLFDFSANLNGLSGYDVKMSDEGEMTSRVSNILSTGAEACKRKMEAEGLPHPVICNFLRLYHEIEQGHTGIIAEEMISPVTSLDRYQDIASTQEYRRLGEEALPKLVVCKLNGGLGTGMGLERAKSLLCVRGDLSFNHIVAEQLMYYRNKTGCDVPLLHMTSFNTERDICEFMTGYPALCLTAMQPNFNQHKHPKVYVDNLMPAQEEDDSLNWNPPGHGDLYAALASTGMLAKLVAAGKRYIFVSNSDNLGAMPDTAILGYLVAHRLPFLLEVAERTAADRKGGHLALRTSDGRLILREAAQAPQAPDGEPSTEFQDTEKYRYFNSNSEWGDLLAWRDAAERHGGTMPLPLIRNEKTVNPRNRESRRVYQIETAMGAAIELFSGANALVIPRSRFSPVKATNDLLGVRSDAYRLREDGSLALDPSREKMGPPVISLDPKYYKLIDDFNSRFTVVPSMLKAREFRIEGNFFFKTALSIEGRVIIRDERSSRGPLAIEEGVTSLLDETYAVTDQGIKRCPLR